MTADMLILACIAAAVVAVVALMLGFVFLCFGALAKAIASARHMRE